MEVSKQCISIFLIGKLAEEYKDHKNISSRSCTALKAAYANFAYACHVSCTSGPSYDMLSTIEMLTSWCQYVNNNIVSLRRNTWFVFIGPLLV